MKRIPIGISFFEELLTNDYYYVDKTEWISEVLDKKVVLYTRPRIFGKTLNMMTLKSFFSNKEEGNLFEGLKMMNHKKAMKYMHQYPTIYMTLKDMQRMKMSEQISKFKSLISDVVSQNRELLTSDKLGEFEKQLMHRYYMRECSDEDLYDALLNISQCLKEHYGKNVIILIDEYDVPLQCAYERGYYDEMACFISKVLRNTLIDNPALEKGILMGYLGFYEDDIFTGLKDIDIHTLIDSENIQGFGFTQKEVNELLEYYHLEECLSEIRDWYGGYRFGDIEIYNPWGTLMYIDRKLMGQSDYAQAYWTNASRRKFLVSDYISLADEVMYQEFETLMKGGIVTKKVKRLLMHTDKDYFENIYSFLLHAGYIAIKQKVDQDTYELVIPNKEIYQIYEDAFEYYLYHYIKVRRESFMTALLEGEESKAEEVLNEVLDKSMDIEDREDYCKLIKRMLSNYGSELNKEIGEGRPSIVIYPNSFRRKVIVIECKHSKDVGNIVADSDKAARQIVEKKYVEGVLAKGYREVVSYGIAFCKKKCSIALVE